MELSYSTITSRIGTVTIDWTTIGCPYDSPINQPVIHQSISQLINPPRVQVCDQPHPGVVLAILKSCVGGDCATANRRMKALYDTGYSSNDIVGTVFRVRAYCMPLLGIFQGPSHARKKKLTVPNQYRVRITQCRTSTGFYKYHLTVPDR